MLSLIVLGGISITSLNIVVAVTCGVIQMGVLSVLRELAKYDPLIVPIYFRHIKYKGYYPARSRLSWKRS